MDENFALTTIWDSAKNLLELPYMIGLFVTCLYLFKFSPFASIFNGRKKEWTLVIGILLGIGFVTVKYVAVGIVPALWNYHLNLLISFCVTTSIYEHLASYILSKLDSILGVRKDNA